MPAAISPRAQDVGYDGTAASTTILASANSPIGQLRSADEDAGTKPQHFIYDKGRAGSTRRTPADDSLRRRAFRACGCYPTSRRSTCCTPGRRTVVRTERGRGLREDAHFPGGSPRIHHDRDGRCGSDARGAEDGRSVRGFQRTPGPSWLCGRFRPLQVGLRRGFTGMSTMTPRADQHARRSSIPRWAILDRGSNCGQPVFDPKRTIATPLC